MALNFQDGFGHQALDAKQHLDHLTGNSVIDGVEPSAADSGLEVDIASGTVIVDGSEASVSAQSVTLDDADPDNPRKDVITIDSSGNAVDYTGTPEEVSPEGDTRFDTNRPAPDDLSGVDEVVVAEVWVDAGATDLVADDVRDRRVFSHIVGSGLSVFGDVDVNSNSIVGLADPVDDQDAATKTYVDDNASSPAGDNRAIQINDNGDFGSETGVEANTDGEIVSDGHVIGDYKISYNSAEDSLDFEYLGGA